MIFSCSSKTKADEVSEAKPNGAGMSEEEIKSLPLEELVCLKSSITNYLKCRKLKNRNNEFLNLYMRINKEISSRGAAGVIIKKQIFETKVDKSPLLVKKTLSSSNISSNNLLTEDNVSKKNGFLKRKFSFSQSLHDIIFPSFLNDKSKLAALEQNNKEKVGKEKQEEASQPTSEIFDEEKPAKATAIKAKKCIKGKLFNHEDFDQGLFNAKIDVNSDDLLIDFLASPSLDNCSSLKEKEIKSILFNEVPEDLFFELE